MKQFSTKLLFLFLAGSVVSLAIAAGLYYTLNNWLSLNTSFAAYVAIVSWLFLTILIGMRFIKAALRPVESMYAALAHMNEAPHDAPPPQPAHYGISKRIVAEVINDVYAISSGQHEQQSKLSARKEFFQTITGLQQNGIVILDRNAQIIFANKAAQSATSFSEEDLHGKQFGEAFDLEYALGNSFMDWLSNSQAEKIQNHYVWERVRHTVSGEQVRYFDMVADYNKNESHGIETIIVLVDKTEQYTADDDQVSFVSLAVHELRSPISLLRGYIEVFNDELGDVLDEDQRLFMQKMSVSASQLSTFVNNILNVARIENDQLKVHLHEDTIYDALNASKDDFSLRAEVRSRKLHYKIGDGIPTVGLDRVAIYEVLSNLIDNAIKYSHDGGDINVIAEKNEQGGVSIQVQDFGVGIPASSLENLFERFYRSHHSRDKVSGTGLGLFLSKRIVEAHGGSIWVNSKEGEGATFGFDIPPFSSIRQTESEADDGNNDTIVRSAHGWIKNHGKVRR